MSQFTPPLNSNNTSQYWGFWGTIGFGLLIFIAFSIVQSMILIAYGFYREGLGTTTNNSDIQNIIQKFAYDGDLISIAEIPSALIGIALVIFFASLKKTQTVTNYLQLHIPEQATKTFLKWIGVMLILFVVMEVANQVLERETPDFMLKVYSSTSNKFMLWIAVAVAAPFFEEFLFRGFLFEGLLNSRAGVGGAIVLTSASWAIIHMQYDSFEIISIFLIGIIFSIAKLKTRSLYVPIAMHMFMNLTASLMMEIGV